MKIFLVWLSARVPGWLARVASKIANFLNPRPKMPTLILNPVRKIKSNYLLFSFPTPDLDQRKLVQLSERPGLSGLREILDRN